MSFLQDNKRLRHLQSSLTVTQNTPPSSLSPPVYVPLRTLSDDQLERIRINREKAFARLVANNHIVLTTTFPNEIWHYILSLLPVPNFQACRHTCKQFKEVIDSVEFAFWKRQRYTTIRKPMSYISYLLCTPEELAEYSIPECFVANHNLNTFNDLVALFTSRLYSSGRILRENPKYSKYGHEVLSIFGHIQGLAPVLEMANLIIHSAGLEDVFPKIGLWAVTVTVLLLSVGWRQVVAIAEALIQFSNAGRPDVIEFLHMMWCILGGTRQWTKQRHIGPTLVFDIGCALNYLESSVFAGKTWAEKQGTSLYAITQEQRVIVECDVMPGEALIVTAFAGAGKTSSLVEYARRRPGKRFLYIAYSKSLEQEAPKIFRRGGCRNVSARTIHSIAYSYYSKLYGHKIREDKTHEQASALTAALNIQTQTARYVLKTLSNFQISKSSIILQAHIPYPAKLHHEQLRRAGKEKEKYTNLDEFYIQLTEKAWALMQDPSNSSVCMTHDGYLKLYQLNVKSIPRMGYDVIMLDEAQDINPVISEIIAVEVSCAGLIMVGDTHQQIYAFRGAVDAMRRYTSGSIRRLNLSQSFRFGAEIATLANVVLHTMKLERKAIFGMGRPSNIFVHRDDAPPKRTIISRSNLGVFRVACHMHGTKKICLWGNTKLDLSYYQDLLYISAGQHSKVRNPKVKKFGTLAEAGKHASIMYDKKLAADLDFVMAYSGREYELHEMIDKLKPAFVKSHEDADIILTNVHQAKGMEWDCVELADDFASCFVETPKGQSLVPFAIEGMSRARQQKLNEETNILYVALTRAKESLVLNSTLKQLLTFCSGEKAILRPVAMQSDIKYQQERKCVACGERGETLPSHVTVELFEYPSHSFFLHQPPADHLHCPSCLLFLSSFPQKREEVCTRCLSHFCPDLLAFVK